MSGTDPELPSAPHALLPGVRLRFRLVRAGGAPSPAASSLRGAIGQQLRETDAAAASAFFMNATQNAAAGNHYDTTPWALRRARSGEYTLAVYANGVAHFGKLLAALMLASTGRIGDHADWCVADLRHERAIGSGDWVSGLPDAVAPWAPPAPAPRADAVVRIALTAPLLIRRSGSMLGPDTLTPGDFVGAVARRLSALLRQAGRQRSAESPAALPATWRDAALRRAEVARYSFRQGQPLSWRGVEGWCELDGASASRCWPLLWAGQFLHAGRLPCMGFGAYRLRVAAQAERG